MENSNSNGSPLYDDNEHLTISEVARRLRFSVDTLKRHMRAGKLREIEWIDFLGNGKLRATTKSVENFIRNRRIDTQKVYNQPIKTSRG